MYVVQWILKSKITVERRIVRFRVAPHTCAMYVARESPTLSKPAMLCEKSGTGRSQSRGGGEVEVARWAARHSALERASTMDGGGDR